MLVPEEVALKEISSRFGIKSALMWAFPDVHHLGNGGFWTADDRSSIEMSQRFKDPGVHVAGEWRDAPRICLAPRLARPSTLGKYLEEPIRERMLQGRERLH